MGTMSGNVFFIGDMHLGHEGIMKFGQRHFDTIEDHDETLIQAWNTVVRKKDDLVWVLGDVAMKPQALQLLHRAAGRKILIMGNHDTMDTKVYLKYFERVKAFEKRYGFIMTHIPIHPNELGYRGWNYNVHGHIHHKEKQPPESNYINVNVDYVGYYQPTPLETIRQEIAHREIESQIS